MEALFVIVWLVVVIGISLAAKKNGVKSKDVGQFIKVVKTSGQSKLSGFQRYTHGKTAFSERESDFASEEEPDAPMPGVPAFAKGPSHGKKVSTLSRLFKEDRQNDWLARQMREEKKRTVWRNFSDLGARHDAVCAADLLRRDHMARHEEGVVDDGMTDN